MGSLCLRLTHTKGKAVNYVGFTKSLDDEKNTENMIENILKN